MLQTESGLIADLLCEVWKAIGRTGEYPKEWKHGLLTAIYKKGEANRPQNYRPVCMLSCARKVIESA